MSELEISVSLRGDRPPDRALHALIDGAGSATRGPDPTPVLIIGMPRSGTTLVEQIVSCHPEVGAGGELNFWNERGPAWHRSGAAETDRAVASQLAAHYLEVLRAIAPRGARVTDKMPFNFLWAGLIHLVFPRATIIHCRRAAVDTALSIHQTHFHTTLAFPTGGVELVAYFRCYQRLTDHLAACPAGGSLHRGRL